MNSRWPIAYKPKQYELHSYLYTIPWSFEKLYISKLSEDDTISICPNVQHLVIDAPCKNISQRFPNIHTLDILNESYLPREKFSGLRRLRHLQTIDINMVSLFPLKRIKTLTLRGKFELLNHSIIYSNLLRLTLRNDSISSLTMAQTLVKYFPNLHSLKIQLEKNTEYFDCVDIFLDGEHLPHLRSFHTDEIGQNILFNDISLWISAKTPLKWKSTPFYGNYDLSNLTICL